MLPHSYQVNDRERARPARRRRAASVGLPDGALRVLRASTQSYKVNRRGPRRVGGDPRAPCRGPAPWLLAKVDGDGATAMICER